MLLGKWRETVEADGQSLLSASETLMKAYWFIFDCVNDCGYSDVSVNIHIGCRTRFQVTVRFTHPLDLEQIIFAKGITMDDLMENFSDKFISYVDPWSEEAVRSVVSRLKDEHCL
jgi:hypothetical protein